MRFRIGTHDGSFHPDDVFAVAALSILMDGVDLIRSRDEATLQVCDFRVDVGRRLDPATGDFDHHQGAGARANGIKYAAFGLVWAEYGRQVAERVITGASAQIAAVIREIDRTLVQPVDADDNGQSLIDSGKPLFGDVTPVTLRQAVMSCNLTWEEQRAGGSHDAQFGQAVSVARLVIERALVQAIGLVRAREFVEEAIAHADDSRVIVLEASVPWTRVVVEQAPNALYVVSPHTVGWSLNAIPRIVGEFANRRDLPSSWAGLIAPAIADQTGVSDALFCHQNGFIATARSRGGALALAHRALAEPPAMGS